LAQDNPGGSFTTVFLSVLDVSSGVLTYSNAGHNPPLLRKTSGAIETLNQASGVMLGIMDEWTYQTHQVQLSAGDALLLYSDGVSEAHNTAKELFGSVRLEQAYSLATGDAQTEVARLLECVDAFAAEAEQFDDITILITRYHAQTKVN
jgi:sigma-B regulation protein RsbU (phosphoserine phosphatase)